MLRGRGFKIIVAIMILFIMIFVFLSAITSQAAIFSKDKLKSINNIQTKQNQFQKQNEKSNYRVIYSIKEDLNGDNRIDDISLLNQNNKRYVLKINDSILQMKGDITSINNISVVDIKTIDAYKEILIEYKKQKLSVYSIYWYDGKNIKELISINSKPEFYGNGEVIVKTDMGFWQKSDIYVLNENSTSGQRVLSLSPQELYDVNVRVVVKKPFKLYSFRDPKKVLTITEKFEVIEIISCDPSNWFKNANQKNNKLFDWYLIKTDKGIQGWARLIDFINSVDWDKKSQ